VVQHHLTRPVEITDDQIRWTDLALDLLVLPDGQQILLDEQEYEALRLSDATRAGVDAALRTLRRWVAEGRPPFEAQDTVLREP